MASNAPTSIITNDISVLPMKAFWSDLTNPTKNEDDILNATRELVRAHGADLRAQENEGPMAGKYETILKGATPLILAALANKPFVVRELLTLGADVNANDTDMFSRSTSLHIAAACDESVGIIQLLLDAKAKTEIGDRNDRTPLHIAAKYGNVAAINLLVDHGACLDASETHGLFPLHVAAAHSMIQSMEALQLKGSDINSPDSHHGRTVLHIGAWLGQATTVEAAINLGADLCFADVDGRTPLHFAAKASTGDAQRLLLAYGADVNVIDHFQLTPLLSVGLSDGKTASLQLLLDCGAEVNAHADGGTTLYSFVTTMGIAEAMALIRAEGGS